MLKNKSTNQTKKNLGKIINEKFGTPISYSEKFIVDLFSQITETLKHKKTIKLKKFGTFNLLFKKERQGRNPKDKKEYKIKSRYVVTFKSSSYLKKIMNK